MNFLFQQIFLTRTLYIVFLLISYKAKGSLAILHSSNFLNAEVLQFITGKGALLREKQLDNKIFK